MKLFLYMAAFIVVVNIAAAYSAAEQGLPVTMGPMGWFMAGLATLLVLAWWLFRERDNKR
jgi:hypothetical protein